MTSRKHGNQVMKSAEHSNLSLLKGLIFETISVLFIWLLINFSKEVGSWMLLVGGIFLLALSWMAYLQFKQIPNKSMPPEKLTGFIGASSIAVTGLVVAVISIVKML